MSGAHARLSSPLARGRLLAAVLALLAARSWGLPLPLWGCPLRHLTGVPCPTCFLTRSVLASFRGDLAGAIQWHAMGPPLLGAGLWLVWEQGIRGRELRRGTTVRWGVAGLALLLGYWLWRLGRWGVSGQLGAWVAAAPLGRWWSGLWLSGLS